MGKKKKNRIFLLLILLLGISIGFAALATTLKINGSASITKNTWNIYWDSIGNEDGVTPAVGDETSIGPDENDVPASLVTWSVTFDKPGDYYEFQVDAVNGGTLDAEILSIEKKYNGSAISTQNPLPAYLKYTVTYVDNGEVPAVGDRLAKRDDSTTPFTPTRRRYKVRVEYDRNAVTNSDINNQVADVTCTFGLAVTYGQASSIPEPEIEITRQTPGTITPGDKVCIGDTECFYVISTDQNETAMLAKYNLLVGNTVDYSTGSAVSTPIDTTGAGYNLQSVNATGYDGTDVRTAVVPFATGPNGYAYWYDIDNYQFKPYPGNINGNPYLYVYDDNSTVYDYVEEYVRKLKDDFNMPSTITGRVLTYEEGNASENIKDENNQSIIINRATSYWFGSAYANNVVFVYSMAQSSSMIDRMGYNDAETCGVRPVIEIPTSLLN